MTVSYKINTPTKVPTGYWLVTPSGRWFISRQPDTEALEALCKKVLKESEGWEYWIDYCLGKYADGSLAWNNLDYSEHFDDAY